MLVRPATAADVPAILPMVRAICAMHRGMDHDKYDFLPDIEERYAHWLPQRAKDPRSIFLAAEFTSKGDRGGPEARPTLVHSAPARPTLAHSALAHAALAHTAIAGFLIATIESEIPIYRIQQFGFIHDVWIEPRHRGQGIARHLVDAAVARMAERGLSQVRLDVAAPNEPARRLFASCGFRESTTEMLRTLTPRAGP